MFPRTSFSKASKVHTETANWYIPKVRDQRTAYHISLKVRVSISSLLANRCIPCLRARIIDGMLPDWYNLVGWLSLSPELRVFVLLLVRSDAGSRLL